MAGRRVTRAWWCGLFSCALVAAVACSSTSDHAGAPLVDGGATATDGATSANDGSVQDGAVVGTDGGVAEAAAPPLPPPVYVTSTHETTSYGGQTRLYDLSIPVDYDAAKTYPLVLSFHGSPGTADLMLQYDPFDGASKTAAIIAYPNALGTDWDLGTATADNPDMGFTQALVTLLAAKYTIDTTHVYGVGWSGGGFFVNQLACRLPGLLRAFASHSGGAPYDDINQPVTHYPNGFTKCGANEAPVAAIIFHGQLDSTVPYASGQFESTYWGYVNGCADSTSPVAPAPCVAHDTCPAATPVTFCGLPSDGHGVSAAGFATSWAFFLALP